jgi:undecaprenyl-diphosphatase
MERSNRRSVVRLAVDKSGGACEMTSIPTLPMIDQDILLALRGPGPFHRPIGPDWLQGSAVELSSLGSPTVLWLVVILAGAMMAASQRGKLAAFFVAATACGFAAVTMLKNLVGRPRPELVPHLVPIHSLSFPSGHAADSAIVYVGLALIAGEAMRSRASRAFVLAAALLLTGLVGLTRVYLGVHWPSDVLGGWVFGLCWARLAKSIAGACGLL